jgi:hypothetical protein
MDLQEIVIMGWQEVLAVRFENREHVASLL